MCRSESSLSHGASRSTSASDADGLAVNGSSSISSVLREQPTGTGANSRLTQQPLRTRLDEMIASSHGRPTVKAVQRLSSYSPVMKRGLTLREAYMPSLQLARQPARQPTTTADSHWWTTSSTSGSNFTSYVPPHRSTSPNINRPTTSEPVQQTALKCQPYLYKLISDADQMRSASRRGRNFGAEASASDASSMTAQSSDSRPAKEDHQTVSGVGAQPRLLKTSPASAHKSGHPSEYFPPPPSADELRSLDQQTSRAASNSGQLGANRVYRSPFLTGEFLSTAPSNLTSHGSEARQQLPVKKFDQKASHQTGSSAAATRSGYLGSKADSAKASAGQWQRSPASRAAAAAAGDDDDGDRRTSLNSTGLSVSKSGVKPASHHEPGRHKFV